MRAPRAAVFALGCALAGTGSARAFCRSTTAAPDAGETCASTGTPLLWPRTCVGLSYFSAGSPDVPREVLYRTLDAVADLWHSAPCDDNGTTQPYFRVVRYEDTAAPPGATPGGPNANTIYFDSVWALDAMHLPYTIAVTRRRQNANTGEIWDADIEFNQRSAGNPDGNHFTTGAAGPDLTDFPTVLLHEVGHVHGIGHSEHDWAIMYYMVGLGEQRRRLTTDDAAAVCSIYPPSRAPADLTCDPTPVGGFARTAPGAAGCSATPARGAVRTPLALLGAVAAVALRRRRTAR